MNIDFIEEIEDNRSVYFFDGKEGRSLVEGENVIRQWSF
jgi:hypothetical protein